MNKTTPICYMVLYCLSRTFTVCLCLAPPQELTEEDKLQILHSSEFITFFDHSTRIVERALSEHVDVFFDYSGREMEEKEGLGKLSDRRVTFLLIPFWVEKAKSCRCLVIGRSVVLLWLDCFLVRSRRGPSCFWTGSLWTSAGPSTVWSPVWTGPLR